VTEVEVEPTVDQRLRWLRRNLTTWLLALVLLLVAAGVGITYTFGVFSADTANPENTISAGSMSQVSSADNAAIMGAANMVPGEQVSGEVTIRNAGDARGDFRLVVKGVDDEPGPSGGVLSDRLVLRVEEGAAGTQVYEGPLGDLDADLGTWEPEEERSYAFVVTFPETSASADNAYQRSSVTATFVWDAVQSR
jgi:hypothetical protein